MQDSSGKKQKTKIHFCVKVIVCFKDKNKSIIIKFPEKNKNILFQCQQIIQVSFFMINSLVQLK